MALFIIAGMLIAKIKKYKISCIFTRLDFYPLFAVEAVFIFFTITALCGNYDYVKYAPHIQKAFVLALIPPILARRLYLQSIIGCGLVIFGTALNRIVMYANGGHMPVYPTLSRYTVYVTDEVLTMGVDDLHIPMTSLTKLNFLADYIDTGFSILSIGDMFIHSFTTIVVFYAIKKMNTVDLQGGDGNA
ncbi:MAG: hypothetical protein CVU97_02555 [Firmicutes bacterium HGW-Firmicutes-21]|nr:MAG: hypothetical protein CVU97_02555 [Firmicutes bacterium HGW-Firmicutes-21]